MVVLWTVETVAKRLREAAETLARLPLNHPGRRLTSSWPDIVRSFKDVKGMTDPGRPRLIPSPAAIDRMDEVIVRWLPRLTATHAEPSSAEDVRLLWSWMARIPAERTAQLLGLSRSTLIRRRKAILAKLADLLNAGQAEGPK